MSKLPVSQRGIDEALELGQVEDAEVRRRYSGRSMYGRNCVGIVGSAGDAIRFVLGLAEVLGTDEVLKVIDDTRTDDMGLSTITYWPSLVFVDEEVENDDS